VKAAGEVTVLESPHVAPRSLLAVLDMLEAAARERTFACADPAKRAAVLHGYLLALEELRRATALP
jgi:hypothetical protein